MSMRRYAVPIVLASLTMSWRRASKRDIAPAKLNPRRSPSSANTAASIVPVPSSASSWFRFELARPIRKPISRHTRMPKNSAIDVPTSFEKDKFMDRFALQYLSSKSPRKCSFFSVYFGEDFLCDVESCVGSGDAAVNRALQQQFLNFVASYFVIQGGSDVHPEFIAAIEGDHHREGYQAARISRETGTRP